MDPKHIVREHLRRLRSEWPDDRPGLVYRGPADFLLQHGRWWMPGKGIPRAPRGAPRACYGNAIAVAALCGIYYVEGFALSPVDAEPVQHAWNARPALRIVAADATWQPPGRAYFGVVFSVERADDATWNGDATVLDDHNRGWPLLRQRWSGERPDPDPAWMPSPALRARLAGDETEVSRQRNIAAREVTDRHLSDLLGRIAP